MIQGCMRGIPEATVIILMAEERTELEGLAHSTKTEHRLRQRARIVLLAADGVASRASCAIWTHSLRLRVPIPLTKRIRFSEFLSMPADGTQDAVLFQKQVPLMAAVHSILPACYLQLNVRRRADKNRFLRPEG